MRRAPPETTALLVALVSIAVCGCAHTSMQVTRTIDGHTVVGPFIPPNEWESAYKRALEERAHPIAARDLESALAAGDTVRAVYCANELVESDDARVREFVGRAYVIAGDGDSLERFVALHADDPAFALAWNEQIEALAPPLDVAVARALARIPLYGARGALALARAGRLEEARAASGRATIRGSGDELAVAEVAFLLGEMERSDALAASAYAHGASVRALELRARALEALGRRPEAEALRARIANASLGSAD